MKTLALSLCLFFSLNLFASDKQEVLILPSMSYEGGLFHNFMNVLGFLEYCEQNNVKNFRVDFGKKGHYYDKQIGSNWWEYYFEPIVQESWLIKLTKWLKYRSLNVSDNLMSFFVYNTEYYLTRQRAHVLIQKYVRLKPDIQEEVDRFAEEHFHGSYTIAVHYRGTDKGLEAPEVPYYKVCDAIHSVIEEKELDNYKIFVATDAQPFLEYIERKFPGRILSTNAMRSSDENPLHYNRTSDIPHYFYQQGRETVIDCVLLSRCNFLIKTSSNLNLCSTFFNPALPVVSLNDRHTMMRMVE